MAGITFDPAKKLPIYFRVARDGSKTLTFVNPAGDDYDISGFTFALTVYDRVGGNAILSLTEGSGLSKPDNYSLTITVTDTQTTLRPNKYFYVLNRTDGGSLVKTWLNGDCFIHEGEFDGLIETTTLTIDESGTAVTVTINDVLYAAPLRVQSVTSAATITPTLPTYEAIKVTALAEALTIANPSGTINEMDFFVVRIKDDGTSRGLTFGSEYRAIGVTLPTATTISKILYIGVIRNATDSKWDVVTVKEEA